MIRHGRTLRILPVALFAMGALLVLKIVDLSRAVPQVIAGQLSEDDALITGSTANATVQGAPASPALAAAAAAAAAGGQAAPASTETGLQVTGAERVLLERLQERRRELDARAKELETREGLLRATEKRLEARVEELKDIEARVNAAVQSRDEEEVKRFRSVVTMYENMRAKDAARLFDRLDIRLLGDVARAMNPRRLADILALMTPEAAERLTVELARAPTPQPAGSGPQPAPRNLPAGELPRVDQRNGS
jgi:flagellar motility protein MotE (MotC chaperone)